MPSLKEMLLQVESRLKNLKNLNKIIVSTRKRDSYEALKSNGDARRPTQTNRLLGFDATSLVGSPRRCRARIIDICSCSGLGMRESLLLVGKVGAVRFGALGG